MVSDGTARIQALRPLGLRSTSLIPQRVFFNIISAIKDVDHDELWLTLLREFRQPKTHAPWLQVAAIETAVSETASSLPQRVQHHHFSGEIDLASSEGLKA